LARGLQGKRGRKPQPNGGPNAPEVDLRKRDVNALLFLLLSGGAAYAASHLGKNTVGTKQLKKNSVTTAKIKKVR
jgi:hypothetical protein